MLSNKLFHEYRIKNKMPSDYLTLIFANLTSEKSLKKKFKNP